MMSVSNLSLCRLPLSVVSMFSSCDQHNQLLLTRWRQVWWRFVSVSPSSPVSSGRVCLRLERTEREGWAERRQETENDEMNNKMKVHPHDWQPLSTVTHLNTHKSCSCSFRIKVSELYGISFFFVQFICGWKPTSRCITAIYCVGAPFLLYQVDYPPCSFKIEAAGWSLSVFLH